MTYRRVIPRDLFNESNLLKCYGRLWILLEGMGGRALARLGDADGDHNGAPFDIQQEAGSGGLTVANLPFTIHGRPYRLTRPLNARSPWPLYATDEDDEETAVFTDSGDFTPEFARLIAKES